jgi:hypothetical protein
LRGRSEKLLLRNKIRSLSKSSKIYIFSLYKPMY